jgi:hypothetical protein
MLERLHDHITNELGLSSRTDTIFIVVAVLFNLIALGINSAASGTAVANRSSGSGSGTGNQAADVVLAVFIVMTILVNAIALAGLYVGRQTRGKLLSGLVAMYTDNQVDKYYDKSLISGYGTRYLLFGGAIIVLALTAIIIPLVIRFL